MSRLTGPKGAARLAYDAVIAELRKAGLTPGPLIRGGKHYKLPVTINGRTHAITLPASPRSSAEDAARMKLADVRRLLRMEGVL